MKYRLLEEHIKRIRPRYQAAGRLEKNRILSEICQDYLYSRKHVIRMLGAKVSEQGSANPGAGRPRLYGPEAVLWLERVWVAMGWLNSKALKAALPEWLPFVEGIGECTRSQLLKMSASTMDRHLEGLRAQTDRRRRTRTRAPRMKGITQLIPQRPLGVKANYPGHMQGDTVAHCGDRLWGRHAWTVNLTCEVSGWSAQRAVGEKSAEFVRDAIISIRNELPFLMRGFHCDNGSEFLNEVMLKYFDDPNSGVTFTHGRAYKKNDQAHVEQKNFTHVRQVFGYERIEGAGLVAMMNDVYKNEHYLLQNFFVPQMKLVEKVRVGARYRKKHDKPQTPYRRLMESPRIPRQIKDRLTSLFEGLNPIELQKSLERKLLVFTEALKNQNVPTDDAVKRAA